MKTDRKNGRGRDRQMFHLLVRFISATMARAGRIHEPRTCVQVSHRVFQCEWQGPKHQHIIQHGTNSFMTSLGSWIRKGIYERFNQNTRLKRKAEKAATFARCKHFLKQIHPERAPRRGIGGHQQERQSLTSRKQDVTHAGFGRSESTCHRLWCLFFYTIIFHHGMI